MKKQNLFLLFGILLGVMVFYPTRAFAQDKKVMDLVLPTNEVTWDDLEFYMTFSEINMIDYVYYDDDIECLTTSNGKCLVKWLDGSDDDHFKFELAEGVEDSELVIDIPDSWHEEAIENLEEDIIQDYSQFRYVLKNVTIPTRDYAEIDFTKKWYDHTYYDVFATVAPYFLVTRSEWNGVDFSDEVDYGIKVRENTEGDWKYTFSNKSTDKELFYVDNDLHYKASDNVTYKDNFSIELTDADIERVKQAIGYHYQSIHFKFGEEPVSEPIVNPITDIEVKVPDTAKNQSIVKIVISCVFVTIGVLYLYRKKPFFINR